jgi:hypothetical protein
MKGEKGGSCKSFGVGIKRTPQVCRAHVDLAERKLAIEPGLEVPGFTRQSADPVAQ